MPPRFIIANGEIYETETCHFLPGILLDNDFRLEDRMWFCNGQIPLFDEQLFLIQKQTLALNLKFPELFKNRNELKRILLRLVNKNKAYHSGLLVPILVYRQNEVETVVTLQPFDSDSYELKKEGLLAAYSENIKYSENIFNSFGFYNQAFWDATRLNKFGNRFDGLIILNEKQEIVEFTGGNIFFIKENVVFTPSPETGCWLPAIRDKILEAASLLNYKTVETRGLNKKNLLEMEEAFVANESNGVQKIIGAGAKRFTHVKTAIINSRLNQLLLGS